MDLKEMLNEKNHVQAKIAKESNYDSKDMLEKAAEYIKQLTAERKMKIRFYKA